MTPWDIMPDYDLARDLWQERQLNAALDRAEKRAHEDEIADGLQSEPDPTPAWNEEDSCT